MRILLIAPRHEAYAADSNLFEPLGLCSVAAAARAAGHDATVFDQADRRYATDRAMIAAAVRAAPDVLGVTAVTASFPRAARIASAVREKAPCTVVFGGVHPTCACDDVLKNRSIDCVVRGEGEETFADLLHALAHRRPLSSVNGIAYRAKGSAVARTEPRERIGDLGALPVPDRRGLPMGRYRQRGVVMSRVASVGGTRGCPHACTFCPSAYGGWGQRRSRPVGSVVDEVEALARENGVRYVFFTDPDFTWSVERVREFCGLMRSRRAGVTWGCYVRADAVDSALAREMAGAGCVFCDIGVESGTEEALKEIRKGATLADTRRAVEALAGADVAVAGNVILGFPWEDRAHVEESLEFYKTLPLDVLGVGYAVPFPATPLNKTAVDEGLIFDWDLSHWTLQRPVMRTRHLSREDLVGLYSKITRSFYFSRAYAARAARRVRRNPLRLVAFAVDAAGAVRRGRFSGGYRG